jgi:hypothetical protein
MYTFFLDRGVVIRDSDEKIIAPCASLNDPDFIEYKNWISRGNSPKVDETIYVPEINEVVPESVTPRQIRLALNSLGLRDMVEDAVALMPRDYRDAWEYSIEIRRDDPALNMFAGQVGLNLDNIFVLASTF